MSFPSWRRRRRIRSVVAALLASSVWHGARQLCAQEDGQSPPAAEVLLRDRLERHPDDPSTWRMLGRWLVEQGRSDEAYEVLRQTVERDWLSAAAWFDFGRAAWGVGNAAEAADAFQHVLELAPDSEYAGPAAEWLEAHAPVTEEVQPAGFEIRQFNGLEQTGEAPVVPLSESVAAPPWPLRLRMDAGLLFNDNVALAPLSRSLTAGRQDSLQLIFSPDVELRLWEAGGWRTGPRFGGDFTWNQERFEQFNLQSYRPGWYVERDVFTSAAALTARIGYEFAHDEFHGRTFGNRHAVTTSLTGFWNNDQATTLYWAADYTDFAADGALPSVTSPDGWTNALGLTHEWSFDSPFLRLLRLGAQVQRADTVGADHTFNGVGLHGEIWIPLTERLDARLRGSWGIRDYPEFQSGAPRDEQLWSIGGELRRWWSEHWSVRLVASFDRFDSRNPEFDAKRFFAGLLVGFEY
jgi:hypothetical protein